MFELTDIKLRAVVEDGHGKNTIENLG